MLLRARGEGTAGRREHRAAGEAPGAAAVPQSSCYRPAYVAGHRSEHGSTSCLRAEDLDDQRLQELLDIGRCIQCSTIHNTAVDGASKEGGACTTSLVKVYTEQIKSGGKSLSWKAVLDEMNKVLKASNYSQMPMLSTSANLQGILEQDFHLARKENEDARKRAVLVIINYRDDDVSLDGNGQRLVYDFKTYICKEPAAGAPGRAHRRPYRLALSFSGDWPELRRRELRRQDAHIRYEEPDACTLRHIQRRRLPNGGILQWRWPAPRSQELRPRDAHL